MSSARRLSSADIVPSHGGPTTLKPAAAICAARSSLNSGSGGPHQKVMMNRSAPGTVARHASDDRGGDGARGWTSPDATWDARGPHAPHSNTNDAAAIDAVADVIGCRRCLRTLTATSHQISASAATASDADMTWYWRPGPAGPRPQRQYGNASVA